MADTTATDGTPDPGREPIAVIGAGYVGLTTAVCLAHLGHRVACADVDADKVRRLSAGEPTIHEAGLPVLLKEGLDAGRLRFTTDPADAVADAAFVYLCVPTPSAPDGSADLTHLRRAAVAISPHLRSGAIVVNKSTVPVGSTRLVEQALARGDIPVVSNPEFLREGTAITDFLEPDRVVIGAEDQAAAGRVASLYLGVRAPIMVTDPASAETTKYAANAFLATKLSFVNAVAAVCEAVGADVNDVLLAMGYDHRIGHEFMRPGPGWGGSCLPKDTRALIRIAEDAGYDFSLLRGVIAVNEEQLDRVVAKIADGVELDGARVAVWGLAFKAGTDDTRDSPALAIVRRLRAAGATVTAYDPQVRVVDLEGLAIAGSALEAARGADALVVATEWDEFKWVDPDELAAAMTGRRIVDARNLLDRAALRRRGFDYVGIGRS
ncbi:MAG: UDP-glucose/GDP-mannose dehydrogenase family protein [Actinomyces sp.]|nr:MAG: UDP-glucose/GDP-mannose dehydrogenase family protein [Actinomyces sp.]